MRKEYNLQILEILKQYFEKNPYMRFHQGLYDLNLIDFDVNVSMDEIEERINQGNILIKDLFNEESKVTLQKLRIMDIIKEDNEQRDI